MTPAAPFANAAAARRAASAILGQSRFHNPAVPRPLHSVLHSIGSALAAPARALNDVVGALAAWLPGGAVTGWLALAALLAVVVALVSRRYSRAALAGERDGGAGSAARAVRAVDLEREAERAERERRFADAVRLRFRAGLRRLSEQGTIPVADAMPTAELSRRLRSPEFEALARRFDEIAYGQAPAQATDAERARQAWRELVTASKRP